VPESGNWHGGTPTRWTAALPAATVWIDLRRAQPWREFPEHTVRSCDGASICLRSRFRRPPVSSRTVGFPESGWRPGLSPLGLPALRRNSSAGSHTPRRCRFTERLDILQTPHASGSASRCGSLRCPSCAESPFALLRRYLFRSGLYWASLEGVTPPSSLIRAHAPNHPPPAAFSVSFGKRVFAGCCQPLLENGPSRRYLRNPCIGA